MSVSVNAPALASDAFPIGGIIMWASHTAPEGNWLECTGASYKRTDYPDLCKILTGSDTVDKFNVPDMRGVVPSGYGYSDGRGDGGNIKDGSGKSLSLLASAGNRNISVNFGRVDIPLPYHAHTTTFYKGGIGRPTIYPAGGNLGNDAGTFHANTDEGWRQWYFVHQYKGNPAKIGGPLFGSAAECSTNYYDLKTVGSNWFNPWNAQTEQYYNWYTGLMNSTTTTVGIVSSPTYKNVGGTSDYITLNKSFYGVTPTICVKFFIKAAN